MPRTQPLDNYPIGHYNALVKRALDDNAPFLVPCSPAQAASIRGSLHAWRRACEADKARAAEAGVDVDRLRAWAVRIVAKGLEVIPASMLVGPGLIEAALGRKVDPVVDEARAKAEASLKALMALQTGTPAEGGDDA